MKTNYEELDEESKKHVDEIYSSLKKELGDELMFVLYLRLENIIIKKSEGFIYLELINNIKKICEHEHKTASQKIELIKNELEK